MTSNSPSSMNSSSKSSPLLNPATAPPQTVSANNRSTTRPPGRPPKEASEDHSQTTIGDGFRVVSKRGHATTITTNNNSPSSSPPAKVANTREVPSPPSKPTDDNDEMGDQDSQDSQPSLDAAQSTHSLLQRINALEIYVAAQDQRIHQLEAIIEQTNFPHQPREADPIIREIQEKLRTIEATPIASYRDIAAKGIPNLASAVIKEQTERQKRSKSIIIRDNNEGSNAISQSPTTLLQDISTWLGTHGLTPDDTTGLSARLIPRKPNLSTHTAASSPVGATIIVTLPSIADRLPIIGKLKRSVRSTPSCNSIYVDPDLTPAEAKAQQALRQERNRLNAARMDEDMTTYHFGIRSGRVVKLQH